MLIGDTIDTDVPQFCKKCHRRFVHPEKFGALTFKTDPVTKKMIVTFICGQCMPKT